jgi:hypothetical protein
MAMLVAPALGGTGAAQSLPESASLATVTSVSGSVTVAHVATGDEQAVGADDESVAPGDLIGVSEDGEAHLSLGDALSTRVFRNSHVQIGAAVPDPSLASQDSLALKRLQPATGTVFDITSGTTYTTVALNPDVDPPVSVSTPGATISATSSRFLVYYDSAAARTWLVVVDGVARVTSAGRSIDVPSAFFTDVSSGKVPSEPKPANRASVGTDLPLLDELSNGVLTDADVLVAAAPEAAAAPAAPDSGPAPLLGGVLPFPTATLRAGQTTVWYWPHHEGDLDTVNQNDTRSVVKGDGVNVSDDGRAELKFQDFNVQIFRHSQLQMIPSTDPDAYGLGYDLVQGATLNTLSAAALQNLTQARVGVRTGWAVVTAVYSAHPTGLSPFALIGSHLANPGDLVAAQVPPADTQFVVNFDGTTTWVVVTQGTVQVEPVVPAAMAGQTTPAPGGPVLVTAGFQTWVPQGQPPVPPVPATRAAVGSQFPTFDSLTSGELTDAKVLGGTKAAPLVATMPAARAAQRLSVRPGVDTFVQQLSALNTGNCTSDPGKFVVTAAPSHGTIRVAVESKVGKDPRCNGKMVRYSVVYYTLSEAAAQSDYFTLRWTAPGIGAPQDYAWLAVAD